MKFASVFPLSGYAGRPPVVSQEFRGARHKGVDLDFRALPSDPPWDGVNTEHRTKLFAMPPKGTLPVRAWRAGIVRLSHELANGGSVRIEHAGDRRLSSLYLHLATRAVPPGEHVEAGQVIGTAGVPHAGQFGHLHFEVRGPGETPLDPVPLLVGAEVLDYAGAPMGPFAHAGSGRRGETTDGS